MSRAVSVTTKLHRHLLALERCLPYQAADAEGAILRRFAGRDLGGREEEGEIAVERVEHQAAAMPSAATPPRMIARRFWSRLHRFVSTASGRAALGGRGGGAVALDLAAPAAHDSGSATSASAHRPKQPHT